MKHNPCQTAPESGSPLALLPGGRILAAPSWVGPGTLAENCAWLAGKVHEVGLLFMESSASLAYGAEDLPPWLASLPLSWHVHLPVDLPWAEGTAGAGRAAEICLGLMSKLGFLGVRRAVLHPPPRVPGGGSFLRPLEVFTTAWQGAGLDSRDLLLENLPETAALEDWLELLEAIRQFSCSFCFDFGHFLLHTDAADKGAGRKAAKGITGLLPEILRATKLFHCCTAAHRSLTQLSPAEREVCAEICSQALALSTPDAVFMLELFKWEDIEASLPVLRDWLETDQERPGEAM